MEGYNRTVNRYWRHYTILQPDLWQAVGVKCNLLILDPPCYYCRHHCGIEDGEEVVLTGGYSKLGHNRPQQAMVTRYNMQGQATTLPSLNTARSGHACGRIKKSDGTMVSIYIQGV